MKLFCFILMLLPSLAFAWIRVGNGGEGVIENGTIYVRDLYEQKTHLDPWFGSAIDPDLKLHFQDFHELSLNPDEVNLILRKATDLESLKPGLGFMLLETIKIYRYSLTDDELYLAPNDSNTVPDNSRTPLATRRYRSIFLQKQRWLSLSSKTRVALLIHEAIYSNSNLDCHENNCVQDSYKIRPIVGKMFSQTGIQDLLPSIEQELNISHLEPFCRAQNLDIKIAVFNKAAIQDDIITRTFNFYYKTTTELKADAKNICNQLAQYNSPQNGAYLSYGENYLEINLKLYQTNMASQEDYIRTQTAADLRLGRFFKRINELSLDQSICQDQLEHMTDADTFDAVRKHQLSTLFIRTQNVCH